MRIGETVWLALALCACSPRDPRTSGSSAANDTTAHQSNAIVARDRRQMPAPSMLPEAADVADVEPGFVAGRRYDHAGISRLRPLSTSASDAAAILRGDPVRRLDFAGGSFSLLWSYVSAVDASASDGAIATVRAIPASSGSTATSGSVSSSSATSRSIASASQTSERASTPVLEVHSGVEVLFDASGIMLQVIDSALEDPRTDSEWSPSYALPEDLQPGSFGGRTRLDTLRAVRVVWLTKHGGAWISGRAYDHAHVPELVPGSTSELDARSKLRGEPVARAEYDDGSYDLVWSYHTQRLSTSVRARFDHERLLREIVSCDPGYIRLPRGASAELEPERDTRAAPKLLRTIDLLDAR